MTDRLKGLVVTFDKDIREDDAQAWIDAISLMKSVVSVAPVIGDVDDHINRERIRHEMRMKLYDSLKED